MNSDGSPVHVQMTIPGASIGSTIDNLRSAAQGENEENTQIYPHMAAIAEQEGFDEIAEVFRRIAEAEREHEIRFRILAGQLYSSALVSLNGSVGIAAMLQRLWKRQLSVQHVPMNKHSKK